MYKAAFVLCAALLAAACAQGGAGNNTGGNVAEGVPLCFGNYSGIDAEQQIQQTKQFLPEEQKSSYNQTVDKWRAFIANQTIFSQFHPQTTNTSYFLPSPQINLTSPSSFCGYYGKGGCCTERHSQVTQQNLSPLVQKYLSSVGDVRQSDDCCAKSMVLFICGLSCAENNYAMYEEDYFKRDKKVLKAHVANATCQSLYSSCKDKKVDNQTWDQLLSSQADGRDKGVAFCELMVKKDSSPSGGNSTYGGGSNSTVGGGSQGGNQTESVSDLDNPQLIQIIVGPNDKPAPSAVANQQLDLSSRFQELCGASNSTGGKNSTQPSSR